MPGTNNFSMVPRHIAPRRPRRSRVASPTAPPHGPTERSTARRRRPHTMGVSGAVSVDTKHNVWKAHMKMALANERTLIAWLRVGATYGAGAVVATALTKEMVNDDRGFTLTVQALLGLLVVAWGTAQFVRRGRLLARRWHGSYESCWGPAIFTLASVISVLLTAGVSIRRIQEYYSDDCPFLPGLNHTPNALPPFFYITFHGSTNPRKAMCHAAQVRVRVRVRVRVSLTLRGLVEPWNVM